MKKYKESNTEEIIFLIKDKNSWVIEDHLNSTFNTFDKTVFDSRSTGNRYVEISCGITKDIQEQILKFLKMKNISYWIIK